jgi:hypothetical protein
MSLGGINKLTYDSELKIVIDTIFLQAMVRGVKSLYSYVNSSGREQFYIKRDSEFELLIYKKYLGEQASAGGLNKAVGGKDVVILTNRRYLGQASSYLQDCPSIQSKLKNTQYAKKSLERLFLSYYACTNSGIEFQKKREKTISEFGILGGVSFTSIKFDGSGFEYILETDYKPAINFSGGLFLNLVLPRNNRKWSIYNEFLLSTYKVNGEFNDYVSPDQYTITYTTLEYSYLKLSNMVRFKYPSKNFSPFINVGLSNGYAIADKNYKREVSKLFALETTKIGKAIDETKKHELGYVAGLGVKLKKYSIEARYERGNGISNYKTLGSPTNRCYLLFGYRF